MLRQRIWQLLPAAIALVLLAAAVIALIEQEGPNRHSMAKVTIGQNDLVYYSPPIVRQDAVALGNALRGLGFFNGRATAVWLGATHHGTKVVSFFLDRGGWDHPLTVATFEEIGRRVAPAIGGYPIVVELADSQWSTHKSLTVGRIASGRDNIYYLGAATEGDAKAFGAALRQAGYLTGEGATVVLSKDTAGYLLGFVIAQGAWDRPGVVPGFQALALRVAPSLGGLPLRVRLLDPAMDPRKEFTVR